MSEIDPQREAEKAATTLAMAAADPMRLAAENAALRSSVKGAHAIAFVMAQRLGGDVTISREEWQSPDPRLELKIDTPADGSVRLRVVPRKNLAIRPKRKRGAR